MVRARLICSCYLILLIKLAEVTLPSGAHPHCNPKMVVERFISMCHAYGGFSIKRETNSADGEVFNSSEKYLYLAWCYIHERFSVTDGHYILGFQALPNRSPYSESMDIESNSGQPLRPQYAPGYNENNGQPIPASYSGSSQPGFNGNNELSQQKQQKYQYPNYQQSFGGGNPQPQQPFYPSAPGPDISDNSVYPSWQHNPNPSSDGSPSASWSLVQNEQIQPQQVQPHRERLHLKSDPNNDPDDFTSFNNYYLNPVYADADWQSAIERWRRNPHVREEIMHFVDSKCCVDGCAFPNDYWELDKRVNLCGMR